MTDALADVDVVLCKVDGCERAVMEPGGQFGRGTQCREHYEESRAAGRRRGGGGSRPRSTTREPSADRPPAGRSNARAGAGLEQRLLALLASAGVFVSIANADDGRAILEGAPALAKALDHLARENPGVKRALELMLATSAWGEVAAAVVAILVPILRNHELLPAPGAAGGGGLPFAPTSSAPYSAGPPPAPNGGEQYVASEPAVATSEHGGNGASWHE